MANEKKKENPCIITTGIVRLSYANIWQPKSIKGSEPKFSASLIIPKSDTKTISRIKSGIKAAYEEGKGILQGKAKNPPPIETLKTPLRDGDADRPDDEAYKNALFVNANSFSAPGIVDINLQEIMDHDVIYSGAYVRAQIAFYAFAKDVNKGIAAGLQNIQKVRDGEPLSGRQRPEDAFNDGFVDEESDYLN